MRALLHGDSLAAFAFNPLAFLGLAVITVLGRLWILEALGGPKVRPPRRLADRLVRVHPTTWLILGLIVAAVYTVLRNPAEPISGGLPRLAEAYACPPRHVPFSVRGLADNGRQTYGIHI